MEPEPVSSSRLEVSRGSAPLQTPNSELRTPPPYAELHCHSNFSFLDGTSNPEDLAERAADLGLTALALTDTNGLYGVVRFSSALKQRADSAGLAPRAILGAELALDDGDRIVLLVQDLAGYRNLC